MTKHTQGPWKYEATSGAIFMDDGDVEALIASTNLESVSVEQGDADGQLIAAAPDLLDALKAILAPLYDEDGIIDLTTATSIVGRDTLDRLQLKGSFIAVLERGMQAIRKAESEAA